MTAESAMRAGRAAAERLMINQCTISRVVRGVDGDGLDTVTETLIYAGRCKVQSVTVQESDIVSAGAPLVVDRLRVDVPVGAGSFAVGDLVQVEGRSRRLRVVGLHEKTFQTAQRLPVEEVIGL